ncbi:MAG: efflux RND transporter periplasmic adaptor subunit, partial [Elusimicrobiaceae bacterium]|nr:efflux RND transporter periplasmic adaptor subunit [Elusimicrobiaceae bacterium]
HGHIYVSLLIILILCIALLVSCKKKEKQNQQTALPVSAVKVLKVDLPWQLEYPALVNASLEVEVRAQVGGILQARNFQEGGFIKQGTPLFQIDETDYALALKTAEGQYKQAKSAYENDLLTFNRVKKLMPSNAVSRQDYDNAYANLLSAKAALDIAAAEVESAKVNLTDTTVQAPISGLIGQSNQTPGNLITVNQVLTTMQQIDPLNINFSMPADDFYSLSSAYENGTLEFSAQDSAPLSVEIILPSGEIYDSIGQIVYFAGSEDGNTSSINIKAQVANPLNKKVLLPKQFVRVKLHGANYKKALVIPSSAILQTTKGNLVYVIENGKAKAVFIEMQNQGNIAIVTKGLEEGQSIVSGGLIKIREGLPLDPHYENFDPIQKPLTVVTNKENGTAALDALLQKYQPNNEQDIRTTAQKNADIYNETLMQGADL